MSFEYEHKLYAQFADAGQPLFFKRLIGGNPEPAFERGGTIFVSLEPAEPTWVYGYSSTSEYAEDRTLEIEVWNRRRAFWSWNFSVIEPNGEPGSVPLDAVEEITREEFEAAAARGWQ
jgi:hypothetical protein